MHRYNINYGLTCKSLSKGAAVLAAQFAMTDFKQAKPLQDDMQRKIDSIVASESRAPCKAAQNTSNAGRRELAKEILEQYKINPYNQGILDGLLFLRALTCTRENNDSILPLILNHLRDNKESPSNTFYKRICALGSEALLEQAGLIPLVQMTPFPFDWSSKWVNALSSQEHLKALYCYLVVQRKLGRLDSIDFSQ